MLEGRKSYERFLFRMLNEIFQSNNDYSQIKVLYHILLFVCPLLKLANGLPILKKIVKIVSFEQL